MPQYANKGEYANHRTIKQLAAFLGVPKRTADRWYAKGVLGEPEVVNELGWKLWSPEQSREILRQVLKYGRPRNGPRRTR